MAQLSELSGARCGLLEMALTAESYQSLQNAGLVDLFESNREQFSEMARTAYQYTRKCVTEAELPVRVDDVIKTLDPALRVTETLTAYLAAHTMKQRYWATRFGDLILDQLWTELQDEPGASTDAAE